MKKEKEKKEEVKEELSLEEKVKEEEQLVENLQVEVEKEKDENKELVRENRKLRFANSFFKLLSFLLFVIVVFVGGWYFGTKLADWENENLNGGNEQEEKQESDLDTEEKTENDEKDSVVEEEKDREVSFSKSEAVKELNEVYGNYLTTFGFISQGASQIDLYNEKYDKLALVPLTNVKSDPDSSYSYVTYEEYKQAYKSFYGNTDNLDKELKMYPDDIYPYLRNDGKVYFQYAIYSPYTNSFSPVSIKYTASDKTYTMTGTYREEAGAESCFPGSYVEASFELKYKIDDNGNKYVVGMKLTKTNEELATNIC